MLAGMRRLNVTAWIRIRFSMGVAWGVLSGWGAAVAAGERPVPLDAGFLRDYAETRGFRSGRPNSFYVTPDGREVLFLRSEARSAKQGLYALDVATGVVRDCTKADSRSSGGVESISEEEKARRERMRVSVGGFTSFQVSADGRWILAPLGDQLHWIERETGADSVLRLGGGAFDPKLSPDGRRVGYVRDHDLWIYDVVRGRERRLTWGGTEDVSHGEAEFVAAEEMDRYTGWWWSPDGSAVVYQESDARGVEIWHVADPSAPERAPRAQRYPRPGKSNVTVRLAVVPVRGGKPVWIRWEADRYPYVARVDWHVAGGLTVTVQSRDQKEVVLLRADPKSGRTERLWVENDAAWVNLDSEMPRWLKDGTGFLWTSEREGGRQLELHGRDGSLRRVVIPREAGYQHLLQLDDVGGTVVVSASADPSRSRLLRVSLVGGSPEPLTPDDGVHGGVFGVSGSVWVHTWGSPEAMPRSWVRGMPGAGAVEIPSKSEEPGFEVRAEQLTVTIGGHGAVGQVPAGDVRVPVEVIRPRNFNPQWRYPVLVDVYGGPHVNVVQSTKGSRLLAQWLADQGFVVVSIENRGTPGHGREWERAIQGRFSEVPLDDQVAGLRALGATHREMDLERVGIVGWSFGGYMSALAVLRRPDVFRAGVAGAPVTDWMDYDTHYTERYLGVPGAQDAVYARNSLISDAGRLARPLLLIHGTGDDNVFFRHSLKLADALFRAGRRFEILPLPGLTHMVPDPVVAERQWTLTAAFFAQHLGVPTGPSGEVNPAR